VKTSPKRSYSVIENERFGRVFAKTGSIISGTVDSNERELLAAIELILGCVKLLENCILTLHFDNMNAATVLEKGSRKFRLQNYALFVDKICRQYNISLRPVWIPRSLNNIADMLSKMFDYEDYSVQDYFYQYVLPITGFVPNFDRFANNWNAKCPQFNSLAYCVGSSGINAFNYSWGGLAKNWLFPPPRLIIKKSWVWPTIGSTMEKCCFLPVHL
jgi:hypothetical protein